MKPLALIIEDNQDQNLVFTTALNQAGFETESILDGATAQLRLTEVVPEVVVLDLHIPDVNGEILLRQIRSDKRLAKVRVMLATADASLAKDLQSQADIVLLKPISFSQLSKLAIRLAA
ncbi:MAG: response regulator transcription factor [Anaerolineae bacterium]|nr:response regulator transcription factor [Anaerolineae bacterium]